MKNMLNKSLLTICAVTATIVLSACATGGAETKVAASAPASGTMFCAKDRLYTASNDLVCNWAKTAAEVCRDNVQSSRIAQSAVVGEPVNASRCMTGQWLVQVSMK
jgi:hypothetical protein